jgi:hypothetical protein
MVDLNNLYILTNGVFNQIEPSDVNERAYLESLIRADYEKCHPDETLDESQTPGAILEGRQRTAARLDGGREAALATNIDAMVPADLRIAAG